MTPVSVTMCRFGSFLEEQTFEFPAGPGLYLMGGENGKGKSTVWKAVTWALFGKDPRGLKAGDVANWDEPKGAWVVFEFDREERGAWMRYAVRRTHSPNSWRMSNGVGDEWDLAKDEGNTLHAMLRLGYEPWLNCVLVAQGEGMFLDLKPEPKAALFSAVMNLDRWSAYSRRAGELAAAAAGERAAVEMEGAMLGGRLAALTQGSLHGAVDDWERGRGERLVAVEADYEAASLAERRLRLACRATEINVADFQARVKPAVDQSNLERERADRAQKKLAEERTRLAVADAEIDRLQALVDLLARAEECPTCGEPIDPRGAGPRRAADALVRARLAARDQFGIAAGAERDYDRAMKASKEASDRSQDELDALRAAQRVDRDAEAAYAMNQRELDRLEDEADRITNEKNPHADMHERNRADADDITRRAVEVAGRARAAADRAERLGFWVRGFKDIRLQLIAEGLEGLAIESNSCAVALGLAGWELAYEVDRETKGGSVSRGFSVYVRSPHNDRPVPWAAWSGGESQRLRVAAQGGLANQIRAATGADIALEVWDEPTDGMDAAGIAALLEWLRERAVAERRQIWVTDHRALGYGGFDGSVTVVRDGGGSRFEPWA